MARKKRTKLPDVNPLFTLVGDGKAGKTELSTRLVNVWANSRRPIAYLRTLTSRPKRPDDPTEDVVYEFTTRRRILQLRRRGSLVEFVNHGGHLYGVTRTEVVRVLGTGLGIIAVTEHGYRDFVRAKLHVVPIKVLPKDRPPKDTDPDPLRRRQDAARARIRIDYWSCVDNSFAPGGKAQAIAALQETMSNYLSR